LAIDTLQAKRYSQAVFEIALERKELDKWNMDLQKLGVLSRNTEFVSVMENPRYALEKKSKFLETQIKGIGKLAANLAYLLTDKGCFSLLSDICSEYGLMLDSYKGIEKAEVTTAIKLDEAEVIKLAEQLGAMSGKKITMSLHVDPQIIGGIIVRIGGRIIDGSTRGQLAALKNELLGYSC
jgi:F-type H+-transporting ATPase subunit delta